MHGQRTNKLQLSVDVAFSTEAQIEDPRVWHTGGGLGAQFKCEANPNENCGVVLEALKNYFVKVNNDMLNSQQTVNGRPVKRVGSTQLQAKVIGAAVKGRPINIESIISAVMKDNETIVADLEQTTFVDVPASALCCIVA